jgi:peptide/nickel transport system substrate-binding protein
VSGAGANGAARTAKPSGKITIVIPSEPRALNSDIDNTSIAIERLVVDNLVNTSPTTYQPLRTGLITNWKQVDPLTWDFTVRKGVRFTNGEKFDAAAAAWDVNHSLTSIKGATAAYVAVIASASARNATTLRIKTKSRVPYLPNVLENIQALPPKYFQQVGDTGFGRTPVGTGPFVLKSWSPGQNIVFAPNPKYYGAKAQIGSIMLTWASEATTRTNLLKTGAVDIATALPVTEQAGGDYDVQRVLGTFIIALEFNMHQAPFSDVRLRRAVAKAINRRLLVSAVFAKGLGATPYQNVFNPQFTSEGKHGDKYITYDPDGARALLKQIGNVPAIDFYWPIGQYLSDDQVGQAITGMLQDVGFRVNQHPMEKAAYFDLLLADKMPGMHLLGGSITLGIEQGNLNSKYLSNSVITYCANGSIDQLAARAATMPAGKKRDAAYNKIEEILISDNVCPVPLYIGKDVYGVSKRVKGFKAYSSGSWASLGQVSVGK